MENDEKKPVSPRKKRKITPERLKNVALYYLERFDSSADNLRRVLNRRVFDHARENPDFDRRQAEAWIEDIIAGFERVGYLDDARYAEAKISAYLAAGKPERWIRQKMKQKGVTRRKRPKTLPAKRRSALSAKAGKSGTPAGRRTWRPLCAQGSAMRSPKTSSAANFLTRAYKRFVNLLFLSYDKKPAG